MSRRQRSLLIRTLLFLFFLNAASFSLYFLLYPQSLPLPDRQTRDITLATQNPQTRDITLATQNPQTLKPWPQLPSFLPWTPNPSPAPRSCEAYFGNGFSTRIPLLGSDGSEGFLRCLYSETLMSSIWEMGRVRMDVDKIRMARGGEELEKVIGRQEEEELPRFEEGAFEIEGDGEDESGSAAVDEEFLDKFVPTGQVNDHTMRKLVGSIRVVEQGKLDCPQVIKFRDLFH